MGAFTCSEVITSKWHFRIPSLLQVTHIESLKALLGCRCMALQNFRAQVGLIPDIQNNPISEVVKLCPR